MRNIDLHKYRTGSVLHGDGTPASRVVAQLLAVTLWRSLGTLCAPLGKVLAAYLWLGRSLLGVASYLEHLLLNLVGWLSGTAFGRRHPLTRLSRFYFDINVRRWHVGIALLVAGGALAALVRRIRNSFDERMRRRAQYQALMASSPTYDQWRALASQLHQLEASDSKAQGQLPPTPPYDRKLLHEKTKHLRHVRQTGNVKEMMFAMRLDLMRNIANIAKCNLQDNYAIIPDSIQRYLTEVKEMLSLIRDWPEHELPTSEKLAFFRETRHSFGRTALLLSGGGSFGTYHMGVCKALFEQRILPRVMAGSSAGAIVSAIIATRTDVELKDHFDNINHFGFDFYHNNHAGAMVHQVLRKGSLQDMAHLIKKLRVLLGDLTFLEAYERTGRILNVTVCPADTNEPPRLLNYLTAPHALVWSAVAASSAFPGLFPPQHLLARNSSGEIVTFSAHCGDGSLERRWRDGSLELDLPAQALGEMFNCNHYIVGQTNPHIVPLLNLKNLLVRRLGRKVANICEAELKHRCQVLQWMLPDWMDSAARFLTLFTQPWEGDITMTLPMDISMQLSPIVNPKRVDLIRLLKVGEVAAWQKLNAIECNCTIEATLDSCMATVSNRVRGRPVAHMQTRIPSWLHMPGLGLPIVASWGDGMFAAVQAGEMERAASWGEHQQENGAPLPSSPWPAHQPSALPAPRGSAVGLVDGHPVRVLSPSMAGGPLRGAPMGVPTVVSKPRLHDSAAEHDGDESRSVSSSSSLALTFAHDQRSSMDLHDPEAQTVHTGASTPTSTSSSSSSSGDAGSNADSNARAGRGRPKQAGVSSRGSSVEVPAAGASTADGYEDRGGREGPWGVGREGGAAAAGARRPRRRQQAEQGPPVGSGGRAATVGKQRQPQQRRGGLLSGRRASTAGTDHVSERELLALAQMDCTDASAGDGSLWPSLLPLTSLGQGTLGAFGGQGLLVQPAGSAKTDSGDALDVFAY